MRRPETLELPHEASLILEHFDRLTPEIVTADGDRMIAEAEAYLRQACGETLPDGSAAPAIEVEQQPNVLEALRGAVDTLGLEAEDEAGIIPYFVRDVHPDKDVRAAGEEQRARLQKFTDNIFSDPKYQPAHDALLAVDSTTLDEQDEQRRTYYLDRFEAARRNQSAAPSQPAETTEETNNPHQVATQASLEFRRNRANVATVQLTPEEFSSLPAETRSQLQATETEDGATVSLTEPSLNYILQNGERGLRQRSYETFYGDRVAGNKQLLKTMAEARRDIARSEGKASWTERQVEGLSLGSPEAVYAFYDTAKAGIVQRYQKAITRMETLLRADSAEGPLTDYDLPYYEKKLMDSIPGANEVTFTLEKTFRGLLSFAESLYGIKIEESPDTPTWAPGVKAYVVRDAGTDTEEGAVLGTFFADLMTRKDADGKGGKRDGGVTYGLRYARTETNAAGEEETTQLPIAAIVANMTPPTADGQEPHMTLRDVETIAHEFGHALHIVLGRSRGPEFGGDKLKFDVREIISMMSEYIPRDPAVLLRFADDGASPEAKRNFTEGLDAIQETREALYSIRLLRLMIADLDLHGPKPSLAMALQHASELMEPAKSDGSWLLAQIHEASPQYAGRVGSTYLFSAEQARKIAAWLRQNNYSPAIGRQLRTILELGGTPGASARLLNFAAQFTAAATGNTAIGDGRP